MELRKEVGWAEVCWEAGEQQREQMSEGVRREAVKLKVGWKRVRGVDEIQGRGYCVVHGCGPYHPCCEAGEWQNMSCRCRWPCWPSAKATKFAGEA